MPAHNDTITLPTWYAYLDRHALREGTTQRGVSTGALRHGPLTIFQPDGGCDLLTFGRDGQNIALFEGYLFDKKRLTAQLDSPYPETREVHLSALAYERWGARLFDHLEGSYLIAIWDNRKRRLIVGHDALGKNPLYYTEQPDGIRFAASIFALVDSGKVPNQLNRLTLALRLISSRRPVGETCFTEIKRACPGCYLEINASGIMREISYWTAAPGDDENWLPEEIVLEEFETWLNRSVERCMELGAQGVMLSGGVDSVSIAALATQYTLSNGLDPLIACSVRTAEGYPPTYEDKMQIRSSQQLGMPYLGFGEKEALAGNRSLNVLLDYVPHYPFPISIWWHAPWLNTLRGLVKRNLSVFVTGSGGDDWLGVHPSYAADTLKDFAIARLIRMIQAARSTGGFSTKAALRHIIWHGGLHPILSAYWGRLAPAHRKSYYRRRIHESLPDWLHLDQQTSEQLVDVLLSRIFPKIDYDRSIPASYYRHAVRLYSGDSAINHDFERDYHLRRHIGIRLLSPFHDRTLVSKLIHISPHVLIHGNRYKGLLRPLVARYLPGLDLENQQKTYLPPEETFSGKSLLADLREVWHKKRLQYLNDLDLVDTRKLQEAFQNSNQMSVVEMGKWVILLSAETWLRAHA